MFKRKPNKTDFDSLLGARTRIDGNLEFSGGLHLDGYVHGNVSCAEPGAILSVSEAGCIDGSVMVANVVLNGVVKGDIVAQGRVQLGPKAQVLGHVHYSVIETAVGAQINGKLIHRAESEAPNPGFD